MLISMILVAIAKTKFVFKKFAMPDRKKNHKENNDFFPENASPVCYINSSELLPEYREEWNEKVKTHTDKDQKGDSNKTDLAIKK